MESEHHTCWAWVKLVATIPYSAFVVRLLCGALVVFTCSDTCLIKCWYLEDNIIRTKEGVRYRSILRFRFHFFQVLKDTWNMRWSIIHSVKATIASALFWQKRRWSKKKHATSHLLLYVFFLLKMQVFYLFLFWNLRDYLLHS